MKAFEIRAERAELSSVLLQAFPVLFDVQWVASVLLPDAFRNQIRNLPIQALALRSESLPLKLLVNVHAPLRGINHWMDVRCHSYQSWLRILPADGLD
jgi:hypothetical protein